MVQWLRLCAPNAGVQSLVGELRSCMLSSVAKKKKKRRGKMQGMPSTGIRGINICQVVINMPGT